MGSIAAIVACGVWPSDAFAYRPFDGTDADVADTGEFELELGPSHFYGQGGRHYLVAPATVLNLGLVPRLELVVDFKGFVALDERLPDESRVRVLDTDVFLKYVVREGALQGKTGLSIACEGGPLTPEIQGDSAFGAQLDTIVSYRWSDLTVHFNEQIGYSRRQHGAFFSSVILEGPHDRAVRPVAEFLVDGAYHEDLVVSALGGAIWRASDAFAFDAGVRVGRVGDERLAELRLGFTWGIPIWEPHKHAENARR
ncbi:MAG TPA: hypothetical protein VIF62_03250 [Labilithrix sp.]